MCHGVHTFTNSHYCSLFKSCSTLPWYNTITYILHLSTSLQCMPSPTETQNIRYKLHSSSWTQNYTIDIQKFCSCCFFKMQVYLYSSALHDDDIHLLSIYLSLSFSIHYNVRFCHIIQYHESKAILRQLWPMSPKSPLTLRSQRYTLYGLLFLPSHKFHWFHSTVSCFRITGHIKTNALKTSKWYWALKRQRYSINVTTTPCLKFHSVLFYC